MTKMFMLTASALALTLTGLAAPSAAAQATPGATPGAVQSDGPGARGRRGARALQMLRAADANGDDQITRAEVEALRAEEFAYRDRDGDGVITAQDLSPTRQRLADMEPAGEGRMQRRRGMGIDADEDGQVTREEFMNAPSPLFDRLDADADGVITGAEIDAGVQAMRERRAARRDGAAQRRD
jgi:ABC-type amino acid transport substrate-binding protein